MQRLLFPLCAFACFALVLWLYYPGIMSGDGAFQYVQVKTGLISNLHPPLMAYLWQLSDAIHPDYGVFWAAALALYWLGVGLVAWRLFTRTWARIVVLLILGLWPPHLYITTAIWKDSWLVISLLFAVWAMLSDLKTPSRRYLAAGFMALLFAAAIRHNAIPALIPLIFWLSWRWITPHPSPLPQGEGSARYAHANGGHGNPLPLGEGGERSEPGEGRLKRLVLLYIAATSFITVAIATIGWAVTNIGVARTSMWPTIGLWDIAAISVATDRMLMPEAAWGVPDLSLAELRREFSPATNTTICRYIEGRGRPVACMEKIPLIRGQLLAADEVAPLFWHWVDLIVQQPLAYLHHRARISCFVLDICPYHMRGILVHSFPHSAYEGHWYEGPKPESIGVQLRTLENALGTRLSERIDWLRAHTIVMSGWPYMLSLLISAGLLWRQRRRPHAQLGLTLNLSAWLMAAPLFFIVPNLQIRYLIWPIVISLLCWLLWLRARRV